MYILQNKGTGKYRFRDTFVIQLDTNHAQFPKKDCQTLRGRMENSWPLQSSSSRAESIERELGEMEVPTEGEAPEL